MRLFTRLVLRYAGRPVVAMGGGMSLPEHAERCPSGSIWLSANEHGALLRQVDYVVSACNPEEKLKALGLPIIGRRHWSDYRVPDWDEWKMGSNSGMAAAYVAWALGGHPVILAGMDCYQGGGTYFHDPKAKSSGLRTSLDSYLERWGRVASIMSGAVIRTCGGPTLSLFRPWDPKEDLGPYAPPPELEVLQRAPVHRARTRALARINGKRVPEGEVYEVSGDELRALIARRTAVQLEGR